MNVLVDTCVWSAAFRKHTIDHESAQVRELRELVAEGGVVMIGPIRQELLSGIRHRHQFEALRDKLRAFPDARLLPADYERAAENFNTCRRNGIQGSNTDFLICAVAERLQTPIFTSDVDFSHFSQHLAIVLHSSRFETGG